MFGIDAIPDEPTEASLKDVLEVLEIYEVWTPEALGYANDVKAGDCIATRYGWLDRIEEVVQFCRDNYVFAVFHDHRVITSS